MMLYLYLRAGRSAAFWQVGPIGLYAGWLTAATGVAIAVLLSGYGIVSAGWAAILLVLAVPAVALWVQLRRPAAVTYHFAVVGALIGIVALVTRYLLRRLRARLGRDG